MSYDPFTRGTFPVGVRTIELHDRVTRAVVAAEVWYPANAWYRTQDRDESTRDRYLIASHWPEQHQDAVRNAAPARNGPWPLIMYFHGAYGHRREATNLTTHLASH